LTVGKKAEADARDIVKQACFSFFFFSFFFFFHWHIGELAHWRIEPLPN